MAHNIVRNDSNTEDMCTKCGKHEPHLEDAEGDETTCIDTADRQVSGYDPDFVI